MSNSNVDGLTLARILIEGEREAQTGFLDLGKLGLTELPAELFELEHLKALNLDPLYEFGAGTRETSGPYMDNQLGDIDPRLGRLRNLQHLAMHAFTVRDASPLGLLTALEHLELDLTHILDPAPLESLVSLRSVNCARTQVADLSSLSNLTSLTSLDCSGTQIADLSPLSNLATLSTLDCSETHVADLSPLSNLASLSTLNCSGTQVADLSPLSNLAALSTLGCWGTHVADLSPLSNLAALSTLDCCATHVADLSPLSNLAALSTLNCSRTQVADLSPLSNLAALSTLDCWGTHVADLSPLSNLAALSTLNCSRTQVADLSPLSNLAALSTLNCWGTHVADLSPLSNLAALSTLNCWGTQVADLSPLSNLAALSTLNCSRTQVADLSPLSNLPTLSALRCSETQVADLSTLSNLPTLSDLDCSDTQIADLSPLSNLPTLSTLNCSTTQVADLSPLSNLLTLSTLDCSGTQIADLSPLSNLPTLSDLDCSGTQVADLSPLSNLPTLSDLDCSGTQVTDLSPLSNLPTLSYLDCSGTQVTDLSPLSNLPSLSDLDCSNTSISDILALVAITSLRALNASSCKLGDLPLRLLSHDSLEWLYLYQTHPSGLPTEVLSKDYHDNCLERIRQHVRDLAAGTEPVRDCKLIVLGNGLVGKTQICRRLRGIDFDASIPSTHGIVVDSIDRGDASDAPILNLWDFGGQDIYHGTHTLFSRTRALFLIVWNSASEAKAEYEHEGLAFRNHPLPYWIEYVRHVGGKDSAVIVLQSQCDQGKDVCPVPPVATEQLDFPFCRLSHYSAKSNRGRATLEEAIDEGIEYLRERDGIATIGRGRAEVIRRLRVWQAQDTGLTRNKRQHRTISWSRFESLCQEVGGVHSPIALLRYLHDSGVVFFQEQNFGTNIVLDQTWVLDAVYAAFDRKTAYRYLTYVKGRFTRSLLGSLAWSEYTSAEQSLFVQLMLACGICFEIRPADKRRDIEAEYVAPDLLPNRASVVSDLEERGWSDAEPSLVIRFEFPFLHFGVIRSLISKIGSEAVTAGVYWKTGVWVRETQTGAAAIIEEERDDQIRGRIMLRVQGRRRKELGRRLAEWMRSNSDLRTCETHVELDGVALDESRTQAYTDPRRRKLELDERRPEPARADEQPRELPLEFTHGDEQPKPSPEVFISYAWNDSSREGKARAEIVDQLCTTLLEHGLEILRDEVHLGVGGRISEFMRRLAAGDFVLVVLSERYLRSPYCMFELFEIYRNCGDDPGRFLNRVIPFVLPDARIDKVGDRLTHALYWKNEFDSIDAQLRQLTPLNIGPATLGDYQQIHNFQRHVAEMLALISDKLIPRDFERMHAEGFSEILQLIRPKPAA